ncbi:MAG: hypothetical protein K2W95_20610 [Candidatus Obscuribacterales bacterium]|nr:hypothetical protein [Candidatus Obscuribacterales bacterium]
MDAERFDEHAFHKSNTALSTLIDGYQRLVGLENALDLEDLPRFREECTQQDKIAVVVLSMLKLPGLLEGFQESIGRLPHHPDDDFMLVRVEHLKRWQDHIRAYASLFFPQRQKEESTSATQIILQVCTSIRASAKCLQNRRKVKGHDQKAYEVANEFDVQDLLHAVIKAYFPSADIECPLPKMAQTASSRADMQLPEQGIIIEAKYVRENYDQKKLLGDLIVDCDYYSTWSELKLLLFVIYDTNKLMNPNALATYISGNRSIREKTFEVKALVV